MSAVIYAAIVVMWAVVLVPMWLRRHDAATESRSVDRFSTAMRILSRRSAGGPDRRYVVMPRREDAMAVHVSGASAPKRRPDRPTVATTSIVVRRRRVLIGLLAVAVLTFLLAVAGTASWLLQVVVDLLLVAFVVHLRAQARRAVAVSRQRRRATAAPSPASSPAPVRRPEVAPPAAAPVPAAGVAAMAGAELPVAAVGSAYLSDDTDEFETWQPIPVPPPTYTLKPPAPSLPAEAPAADVGDVVFDQEAIPEQPAAAADDRYTDLDEILEHRWAVND